jgi:pyridoxal 5'-phosphate synthase pdxT subunit
VPQVAQGSQGLRTIVGVLALQGAFREHTEALVALGGDVDVVEVRRPEQLDALDALVLPGGESTAMSKLLVTSGLLEPLAERLACGLAVLGTCAGLILLASEVGGARPDQHWFSTIDVAVARNAYGRQLDSFEADLDIGAIAAGDPFRGVFIRAPGIDRVGAGVEVLITHEGHPVAVRQGRAVGLAFHPELSGDLRIHHWFLHDIVQDDHLRRTA